MPYYLVRYSYQDRTGHETVWAECMDQAKDAFWEKTGYSKDIVQIDSVEA